MEIKNNNELIKTYYIMYLIDIIYMNIIYIYTYNVYLIFKFI